MPSHHRRRTDEDQRLYGVQRIYHWGSWVAGLLLAAGLILRTLGTESSPRLLSPDSLKGGPLLEVALIVLWSIPIAGLLGAGVGLLRRNRTDRVGWLALILCFSLVASWLLL